MYEKELQRILTASQNNALTFFVGAGVSALSGAPTWKGLIHAISDKKGVFAMVFSITHRCVNLIRASCYSI